MESLKKSLGTVIATLSEHTRIGVHGVHPNELQNLIKEMGKPSLNVDNLTLSGISTDDAWCRDHGPTFIYDAESESLRGIDWNFNAWGEKYHPFGEDHRLAARMLEQLEVERIRCAFVGEGGAVEVDGSGTVMLTKSVLLNENRNPGIQPKTVEQWMCEFLGCDRVFWFESGLDCDDTDGHIDMFARFVSDEAIVYATTENPNHPQYRACQLIKEQLEGMRTRTGGHYDLIELSLPDPIISHGEICPATYANFLVFNEHVVVPQYGEKRADMLAQGILSECFPTYRSILFDSRDSITEGGSIHCLTQQQPIKNSGHNVSVRNPNVSDPVS
jgi:agmatine deiminase